MEKTDVAWIGSALELAHELATQLSEAKDEAGKAESLARLNLVLNDIARTVRGEDGGGPIHVNEDCCTACWPKYHNDPVKYRNCVMTCTHTC